MNTDLWYDLYAVNRNNLLYLPEVTIASRIHLVTLHVFS